jgi:hypothetical protein
MESNSPPQNWRMAVVEEVHPGCDGLVQVATIKDINRKHKNTPFTS